MWFFLGILALAIVSAFVYGILKSDEFLEKAIKNSEKNKIIVLQTEAKSRLAGAHTALMADSIEFGKFSADSFESYLDNELSADFKYKLTADQSDPVVQEYCTDCGISESGFAIMAYANLDEDPDLDIWVIDDKKQLVNISSDIND